MKKILVTTVGILAGLVMALPAFAAVSYQGFVFDQVVTTSQGTDYYVDLISGPNLVQMTDGKYDLEAVLGFYGATDPDNDGYFTSEIDDKTYVKYKLKGGSSYIAQTETSASGSTNIPNTPGRMIYYVMRSSANGYYVNPGEYTVDAVHNGTVVASYDVCLPTFTSSTGNSIGAVTCGNQPPGGGGAGGGGANAGLTGKFTFPPAGTVPTASCNTSSETCTFGTLLKGTQTGNVAVVLNFYPADNHDSGGTKGFTLNGYSYQVKIYSGKSDQATITVPYSALVAKMDSMQEPNRKYYIEFYDVADPQHVSYKKFFDFGSYITAAPAQNSSNITYQLVSLMAPDTTATIKGTLTSSPTFTGASIDVYAAPATFPLQKLKTAEFTGDIDSTGIGFTTTLSGLNDHETYNFRLIESTTGTIIYDGSFSTNISSDQAGATVAEDAECGPANGQSYASEPDPNLLCAVGTAGAVSGGTSGPWNWVCEGINQGSNIACDADTLSTGGASDCGPAADVESESMPTSGLCVSGTPSSVSDNGGSDTWWWSCTIDNTQYNCHTGKVATSSGGDVDTEKDDGLGANFLKNPFKSLDTFPKIIKAVVDNIILPIAIPVIAVMLIYSGMLFVIARRNGNVDGYAKAKSTLLYTLLGATLVLGAFVIASALQSTLDSLVATRYEVTNTRNI